MRLVISILLVWSAWGAAAFADETAPFDFSKADWELDGDGEGVKVYKWTPPNSDLFAFRAEGDIQASVPKLLQILIDVTRRMEWAPTLSETYVVRWLSPIERIEYERVKTPFIIKDRDFVIRGKAVFDGKGGVSLPFHSVTDAEVPEKGPVRGEVFDSTYTLTPSADRKSTKLEYRMLIDPKGSVPKWIVNFFQGKFPHNMILNLRKQVLKPGIPDYPMPPGSGWENTANSATPVTK